MSGHDRFGTIFEVMKTVAIRHRVREQETRTDCGLVIASSYQPDHDLPWSKEKRCLECYPKLKKSKKRRTK